MGMAGRLCDDPRTREASETPATRSGRAPGINSSSIRSPCQKPPFRKSVSSPIISMSSPTMSCWSRSSNPRSRYVCTTRCSNRVRWSICASAPRAGFRIPNLTDTTLSTDLLLLDRCFVELRKSRAARAALAGQGGRPGTGHCPGARERFDGVQRVPHRIPDDTNVKLVSCDTHVDHVQLAAFPSRHGARSQRTSCRSTLG